MRSRTIYRNGNSKSYNAELAESNGRYPRTVAARELGMSTKVFDACCQHVEYVTNEWHHVSKYANKVDYYDTVELSENIRFWMYAAKISKGKKKTEYIDNVMELARVSWMKRMSITQVKTHNFTTDIRKRVESLGIPFDAFFDALPQDQSIEARNEGKKCQSIQNGTYTQEDIYFDSRCRPIHTGNYSTIARYKHIIEFDLTIENIRKVFTNAKVKKQNSYASHDYFQRNYRGRLNVSALKKGIENLKAGIGFNSHNSFMGMNQETDDARRVIIDRFNSRKLLSIAC